MVDPELKNLLEKNLETSEETLKAVKGMRSLQRWGSFFMVLKWVIIIGISLGAYYYIEPYLQQALNAYNELNGTVSKVQSLGDRVDSATASSTDFMKKLEGMLRGL